MIYTGGRLPAEDLSLFDNSLGNDVQDSEAADAGFEIQDEDAVFGLITDAVADMGDEN